MAQVLDGGSAAWRTLQGENPNLALELGYQVGLLPTPNVPYEAPVVEAAPVKVRTDASGVTALGGSVPGATRLRGLAQGTDEAARGVESIM